MTWQRDDETDLDDLDEDDASDDSGTDELPCPSCGRMIFEDTDRCPHCGDWVMPLAAAARQRPWIWWTALSLALALFVTWVVMR